MPNPRLTAWIGLLPLWLAACPSSEGEQDRDQGLLDGGADVTVDLPGSDKDTSPPLPDGPPPPGVFSEVSSFGSNPGALRMFKHVPGAPPAKAAPLVVVLHGCSLTAADYAVASGWNDLADRRRFYVLYPQQSTANNQSVCFNWFEPGDTGRDQGEAHSIAQMVDRMKQDHAIDSKRVFATGLSAGAAMTIALGVAYPDRFAGLATAAGIPAGCATSTASAYTCMTGVNKTAAEWTAAARKANPSFAGTYPVIASFHGTKDSMVAFSNLGELVEQWTGLHGTDTIPEVTDTLAGQPHRVYKDKQGRTVVETFEIQGMDHGIPINPGSGPEQGGKPSWFAFNVKLWSTYHAAKLWGI